MAKREYKRLLQTAVILLFAGAFMWNCANIVSPQGGPRDSLPPVIIGATPALFTTNFEGKRIYLAFNEFVQLKDQQKEFFVSPPMKKNPTLSLKNRGIQIDIADTLKENTTYALNFGTSIRDNNEGNILNGVRYVFSTGPQIDSLFVSGYTVDSSKGDSLGKTFIFFYDAAIDSIPQYDSTLLNNRPLAIARAQTNGIFIAQNLKPIDYRIYAFEDTNGNMTYDPETDKVGFLDSVCNPLRLPEFKVWFDTTRHYLTADPQIYFAMFTDTRFKRQTLSASTRPEQHLVNLQFGAPYPEILSIKFDSIDTKDVVTEYVTADRDTVNYWLAVPPEQLPDTVRAEVIYMKHDSINVLRPDTARLKLFWKYFESKEAKKEREAEEKKREQAEKDSVEYVAPVKPNPFKVTVASGDVNPERSVEFLFTSPLTTIDTTRFVLRSIDAPAQTATKQPAAGGSGGATDSFATEGKEETFHFVQDTLDMKKWWLRTEWSATKRYKLTIPAGAFANVKGEQNDTLNNEFGVMRSEKFATLDVNVKAKSDTSRYVLYLLDEKGSVIDSKRNVKSGKYTFMYVPEGNVRVRVLEDLNGNGVWDTGNLIERRQPERAEPYRNDNGEELIATKMNWKVEITADMNVIFAPLTTDQIRDRIEVMEQARLKKRAEDRAKRAQDAQRSGSNSKSGGGMGIGSSMSGMKSAAGSIGK